MLRRSIFALALALFALVPQAHAQRGHSRPLDTQPPEPRVAWHYLQGDAVLHDKPITLYWIPVSLDDVERSPLTTSRTLLDASARCVDLEIVLPAQAALVEKLGMKGKSPVALIVDRQGNTVRTAENVHGKLAAKDVERMLGGELDAREEAMYRDMTSANQQAGAGNRAAAIALYEKIWNDRCLFSTAGAEARHALERLGVIVNDEPPTPPKATPPPAKTGRG